MPVAKYVLHKVFDAMTSSSAHLSWQILPVETIET